MNNITIDQIVSKYGTHHDGISVFDHRKRVGYITDLRQCIYRNITKNMKQKEYSGKATEKRREAMPDAVMEMKSFLQDQLTKYGAEVFINISQPNVSLNGHKIYVIVDPIYGKHRLGIMHNYLTYDEMAAELDNSYSVVSNASRNHLLINSIDQDGIVEVVLKLCGRS